MREQRLGGVAQERRDLAIARRAASARPRARAPCGVGTMKRAGPQEGEQFEQVEPRQLGIAQPLPDQRRVEQDHRRIGGDPDRLAPPDRARPSAVGDPDAAMAGVERGIGERQASAPIMIGEPNESGNGAIASAPSPPAIIALRRSASRGVARPVDARRAHLGQARYRHATVFANA